jgi:inorganic pyrophosphatase
MYTMKFPQAFYRWRPHPWHGLEPGARCPEIIEAYIELTPFDTAKFEIDKTTGYLRVDRPQRGSSLPPALYGFIPRTYCGDRVKALSPTSLRGDGDPLDICVVSERTIARSEIIISARVLGGFQMIDDGEADDKIIAVMTTDNIWGEARELSDLPVALIDRLHHYFSTYKLVPGQPAKAEILGTYGREQAFKVINASLADYEEEFGSRS